MRYGLNRERPTAHAFFDRLRFHATRVPAALKAVADALEFPRFDVNGLSSLGQETFNDLGIFQTTHSFNTNVTKTYCAPHAQVRAWITAS